MNFESNSVVRRSRISCVSKQLFAMSMLIAALTVSGCGPTYPKCDQDKDCHKAEFCVNNQCQQCRGSQDCAAGQRCAAGACEAIPGYCTSSSQCGAGKECQDNMCVTMTQSMPTEPAPVAGPSGPCELQPVYFDYDSSTLADSARQQLSQNAQCIRDRGMKAVHLTGLTDPRGTEEYNLALGDHRAQSAQQYLKSLGTEAKITESSKGEELATGTDEGSWARDRRVDLKAK